MRASSSIEGVVKLPHMPHLVTSDHGIYMPPLSGAQQRPKLRDVQLLRSSKLGAQRVQGRRGYAVLAGGWNESRPGVENDWRIA